MKKLIILLLALFITNILNSQTIDLSIVPSPKIVKSFSGIFQLEDNLRISTELISNDVAYSIELIRKTLKEFNGISSTLSDEGILEISYIRIDEQDHVISNLGEEGYIVKILPNKIELKAKTARGIYYAATTLIQLLEKADGKLPCLEIVDWPDMKIRGISDDISRGQVSNLENFKKIISHIARYKMNTYMPYLEDMLEFNKYPSIGKGRGALTKHEVSEIVSFAKKNFVEVIPIFQTLGHYENILSQEEFLKYAEFPGASSLNVSIDETYTFLEDLLQEVFALFPSEYFHMGADESWDVGLGKSKKLVSETNIAVVHANHYKKVYSICKKYNKKVMMYGDILLDHPEILSLIPKDITIVDWHYGAEINYSSTRIIRDAGFNYLVSPSVWNFVSTFPVNSISLPNIKNITKSGIENESIGMINSNWGDYGAETFKEFVLFNYAWSAQCAWELNNSELDKFTQNYFYDFFGVKDSRLPNIYKILSNPQNQIPWHNIWRHPLLKFKQPGWWEPRISEVERISWNEFTLPEIRKDVEQLKHLVKKNSDHLDLIEYILKLTDWYKTKVETQFVLRNFLDIKSVVDVRNISNRIGEDINTLKSLRRDFRKLWLRYYKDSNLNMIEDKFDRLILYFQEINEDLASGSLQNFNPLITSKWLYYKPNDSTYASQAEFTASFELEGNIEEAFFQLMGNTFVKLFINGKFVDEVFARHSLSLLVDYKRIKLINVKPYLVSGRNTVQIVAENYNHNNGAGFNLLGRIKSGNEEHLIMSDDSQNNELRWSGRETGTLEWKATVSKPYSLEVITPNFNIKRTSWIER